ncbi:hypothetical protein FACS189432_08540 [Bacteroidia bacterium]|nr:hypothetical protein FACS189432_08540 [Bacteroidia bacterium]
MDLDLNVNYLKRCIAIPGNTFYIENGIYKVKNSPDILGNREAQLAFSQLKPEDIPPEIFRYFPLDSLYGWNVKSFGPLYVPKKGDGAQQGYSGTLWQGSGRQREIGENG